MTETSADALPRRDFIVLAACAFVGVGSAVSLWPFIDQMNPNGATQLPPVTDVDLRPIEPGQMIQVAWRGQPIVIRHRTPEEIERMRGTPLGNLPDQLARNAMLPPRTPATDSNRVKAGHDTWLVVVGLCTHLGCLLKPEPAADMAAEGIGLFCACHAARFDHSGRVRSGPARTNLPVPPYRFLSPTSIRIG
jgi:ubiquinol-cytochrome c reductase iron-sulfur subunit